MTRRPIVITLLIENRLSELVAEISSVPVISHGVCGPENANAFFSEEPDDITTALDMCSRCPAQAQCLRAALETGAVGIWGATTTEQRRGMGWLSDLRDLPTVREAALELNQILTMSPAYLSRKYEVDRRTVNRWKRSVKSSSAGLRLAVATV